MSIDTAFRDFTRAWAAEREPFDLEAPAVRALLADPLRRFGMVSQAKCNGGRVYVAVTLPMRRPAGGEQLRLT